MQAQDATTLFLLKFWPWVEANRAKIIAATAVVAVAALVIWFMINQRESKQIAAGQALTQVALTGGGQLADAYLKVATEYPGTVAGQRALMQSAVALFESGKFPDAQARFQNYLDAHPNGQFSDQALLGVATSLDAQGKTDLAAAAYKQVISNGSDSAAVSAAKYDLAKIDESQGRLNDALVLYQDVASAQIRGPFSSEAGVRLMELRNKLPAASSATNPAVSVMPGQ